MTDAGNAVTAQAQSDKGEALHFYAEESRDRLLHNGSRTDSKIQHCQADLGGVFCLLQGDFVI